MLVALNFRTGDLSNLFRLQLIDFYSIRPPFSLCTSFLRRISSVLDMQCVQFKRKIRPGKLICPRGLGQMYRCHATQRIPTASIIGSFASAHFTYVTTVAVAVTSYVQRNRTVSNICMSQMQRAGNVACVLCTERSHTTNHVQYDLMFWVAF